METNNEFENVISLTEYLMFTNNGFLTWIYARNYVEARRMAESIISVDMNLMGYSVIERNKFNSLIMN